MDIAPSREKLESIYQGLSGRFNVHLDDGNFNARVFTGYYLFRSVADRAIAGLEARATDRNAYMPGLLCECDDYVTRIEKWMAGLPRVPAFRGQTMLESIWTDTTYGELRSWAMGALNTLRCLRPRLCVAGAPRHGRSSSA